MEGKLFDNRFEIIELIDKGGTSNIYRAVDRKTKRITAVKVLKKDLSKDQSFVKRFETEMQAMMALEHSNIVQIIDAGHIEDTYFLVMEFVEGQTLKQMIKDQGALDIQQAVDISISVCQALNFAHNEGFVHLDIKPQNIMINNEGQVKITDFGIARNTTVIERHKTQEKVVGSVQYIPPEQAKGERTDRRADVYSLGISLFEMVTGTLPFEGEKTEEVALKHIHEPMPYPKKRNDRINDALSKIILKATRKNKRLRYSNMKDFANDLKQCFDHPGGEYVKLEFEHVRINRPDPKAIRKRIIISIAMVLASALVVVAILVSLAMFGHRSNAEETAPPPITAPVFVGLDELESTDLANESGVKLERQYVYSDTVPEGEIISQAPEEGSSMQANGTVTIIFSQGPEMALIPDLVNMTLDDARDILTENDITIGEIEYIDSDLPAGYVVAQDPMAGESLPDDEVINLTVSRIIDLDSAVVPDFSGLSVEEVIVMFEDLDFPICYAYLEKDEDDKIREPYGVVLNQTPHEGIEEDTENPIFIWISAYPNNYHINKKIELSVAQEDTLVRVTISEEGSPVEFVMMEDKVGKGDVVLEVELLSFEAKEKYMSVYVNDEQIMMSLLMSWERIPE